ncbi:MAG: O-antigen ligase family protein [Fibrobacteria bacterium]
MNVYRAGYWTTLVFFLVDLGQVHTMVPGLRYLKLGFVSQTILLALVVLEIGRVKWLKPMAIARIAFFLGVVICTIFAINMGMARRVITTEFFRVFAGFLGFCIFVRTGEDLKKIHWIIVVLCLATALWTLVYGGHGPGMLYDENDVAMVLVMLLPFSFLKIYTESSPKKIAFLLAVFMITLGGIAATLSRGGMVGALPTLAFIWLKAKHKVRNAVILFLVLVAAVLTAPPKLISEFNSIKETDQGTAKSRRYFWHLSTQLFQARPLTGVGPACWYHGVWSGLIPNPGQVSNITPHSVYFQLISEMGMVGIATWGGFVITMCFVLYGMRDARLSRESGLLLMHARGDPLLVRDLHRRRLFFGSFSLAIGVGLCGFLLSGTFLSVVYYPQLFALGALAQAVRTCWDNDLMVSLATLGIRRPAAGPKQTIRKIAERPTLSPGPEGPEPQAS